MSDKPDSRDARIVRVVGKGYSYQFSRGLLAHSLELRGLPLDKSYKVARKVHNVLVGAGISSITEEDLREYNLTWKDDCRKAGISTNRIYINYCSDFT
jgi:2-phosphoglycerate kinase